MVLPYSMTKRLPGLRLITPDVKVEQDRIPCCLGDYNYFKTNAETLPVACLSAMQYGRALDCLLRELVYADPAIVYVYLLKSHISDGFYRIWLRPEDAPKLGMILPSGTSLLFRHSIRSHIRLPNPHDSLCRPSLGPVYLLKADVSDEFYRIGLLPEDAPMLRLILPSGILVRNHIAWRTSKLLVKSWR